MIHELTKLSRGEALLKLNQSDLDDDEISQLLQLCKADAAPVPNHWARRRHCFAVLYVLGASWTDIGRLYNIARQTVMDGARRSGELDRTPRLATKMTWERLSDYNAVYWNNVNQLSTMSLHDAAAWLAGNTETDDEQ
jgi:hypothetical protein